ncbi:MAG: hypothetical protein VZS44_09515 [Bacilli bacterium]|nr:hypothetical protein [Bacilli bacterium]
MFTINIDGNNYEVGNFCELSASVQEQVLKNIVSDEYASWSYDFASTERGIELGNIIPNTLKYLHESGLVVYDDEAHIVGLGATEDTINWLSIEIQLYDACIMDLLDESDREELMVKFGIKDYYSIFNHTYSKKCTLVVSYAPDTNIPQYYFTSWDDDLQIDKNEFMADILNILHSHKPQVLVDAEKMAISEFKEYIQNRLSYYQEETTVYNTKEDYINNYGDLWTIDGKEVSMYDNGDFYIRG